MLQTSAMMIDGQKVRQDFSRAALRYAEEARMQKSVVSDSLSLVGELLPCKDGSNLLDVGGGTGFFSQEMRSRDLYDNHLITQIDIAEPMALMAREHCSKSVCADALHLPFGSGTMDGIFSSLCVQWIEELDDFFAEMARMLKSGGTLMVTSLGPKTLWELKEAFGSAELSIPVNQFRELEMYEFFAKQNGLDVVFASSDMRVEMFDSPRDVMRHLRIIGANYKPSEPSKTLRGISALRKVEAAYPATVSTGEPLRDKPPKSDKKRGGETPASFEIISLLCRKSEV